MARAEHPTIVAFENPAVRAHTFLQVFHLIFVAASRIPSPLPMDLDGDRNSNTPSPSRSRSLSPGANMRGRLHIEIEHHPHSGLDNTIILLDAAPGSLAPIRPTRSTVPLSRRPWAPFPTRPDFEWSETMHLQSRDHIQAQLKGIHGSWNPHGTAITIKTYAELQGLLEKSRTTGMCP
ncbi:hypothetical protein C8F01DRAFT_1263609 [Mycena amicta]|nr:hypothetical protein C8F01DRAFT_1263609 [Mycena amicta]